MKRSLSILFFIFSGLIYSQGITLKGVITDEGGNYLKDVNIREKKSLLCIPWSAVCFADPKRETESSWKKMYMQSTLCTPQERGPLLQWSVRSKARKLYDFSTYYNALQAKPTKNKIYRWVAILQALQLSVMVASLVILLLPVSASWSYQWTDEGRRSYSSLLHGQQTEIRSK